MAGALSLCSGVCFGQFFNGQAVKGVCILGLSLVVQLTLILLGNYLLMGIVLVLTLVGSAINAFVSAIRLNRQVSRVLKSDPPNVQDGLQPAVVADH